MYLARLTLNPRTRRVQGELANRYELHRTLMAAFPETLPEGERVLYRLDQDARSGIPTVLLQSRTRPDWAWLGDPGARNYLMEAPETKRFELGFADGQQLAYRLVANPTVKRWLPSDKDDPDSEKKPMRIPLTGEEDLRHWIDRKGERGGFRIASARIVEEADVVGWKTRRSNPLDGADSRRRLTFSAVRFEGILVVKDPVKLVTTVQQGIGSGKAFGFGLLSLARI